MRVGERPTIGEIELMDGAAVDDVLFRLAQHDRESERLRAAAIARGVAVGFADSVGFRSTTGWVAANANMSPVAARRHVSIAHAVAGLPYLAKALGDGQVGVDQAGLLARLWANGRVREALVEMEEVLVGFAVDLPLHQFQLVLARFMAGADPDGTIADNDDARRQRGAASRTDGAVWELRAVTDAVNGEEIDTIWQHFIDVEFQADWAAAKAVHGDDVDVCHLARTDRQRRMDAFTAMARAAKNATPAIAADPAVRIVADPATTIAAILEHFGFPIPPLDPRDFTTRMCETLAGNQITREQLLAALHIGRIATMINEAGTRTVEAGRQQRLFTKAMRDALEILDRWCTFPGCTMPAAQCDIDHVTPWTTGGTTGTSNGDALCRTHNRLKHQLGLQPRWHNGHWHWYTPNGTPITPTTRPDQHDDNDDQRGPPG